MANKKRLIDANALLEAYWEEQKKPGIYSIAKMITEAPTVDAVEVVHGRCWLCEDYDRFVETVCYLPNDNGGSTTIPINYCPNCGAKMDGDGNA